MEIVVPHSQDDLQTGLGEARNEQKFHVLKNLSPQGRDPDQNYKYDLHGNEIGPTDLPVTWRVDSHLTSKGKK